MMDIHENRPPYNPRTARSLILDELFDLTLYRSLRGISSPPLQTLLDELIKVETKHLAFWQEFFNDKTSVLDTARRVKLGVIRSACKLFGATAVHLVLEAIEVYGVRKYLALWEKYKDGPLGHAVKGILEDEFRHEDAIVSRLTERKISPDRIRNIFLGVNDGMVEILGAVNGFFAAFSQASLVLAAGLTTAVAGALSMAAGAYAASSSENEVRRVETGKARFLGQDRGPDPTGDSPAGSALIVGIGYFAGAAVPILPVAFGAGTALVSVMTAGATILLVSTVLAFLSGMDVRRRALTNLAILAGAVGITYAIGILARNILGAAS